VIRELGQLFREFAIQGEAHVSVQFLLELEKLLVTEVPRARLKHDEDDFAGRTIFCQRIEHGRVGDAVAGMGAVVAAFARFFRVAGAALAAGVFSHGAKGMDEECPPVKRWSV
jgi:hypothetical protein